MNKNLPIGVFDSGMGGLTVLKALMERLPHESMLYLGDTARLPYGTKSQATVTRYAVQAAGKLVERQIKMLVIACNTATAAGLGTLQKAWPDIPVIGVIEPGAKAACAASRTGHIAVIATESTIKNGAYQKAIRAIRPDAEVTGQACSLFVPLAEEGWLDGEIVEAVAQRYLGALFPKSPGSDQPDCVVLGCTHFPPLASSIAKVVGEGIEIVDSAATTALAVQEALVAQNLASTAQGRGGAHFLTTDDATRFAKTGGLFLGRSLSPDDIELVNL